MSGFAKGIQYLFTGSAGGEQQQQQAALQAEQQRQQEAQRALLTQQAGQANAENLTREKQLTAARRAPRGRRLLLAATGEAGLPDTLGG